MERSNDPEQSSCELEMEISTVPMSTPPSLTKSCVSTSSKSSNMSSQTTKPIPFNEEEAKEQTMEFLLEQMHIHMKKKNKKKQLGCAAECRKYKEELLTRILAMEQALNEAELKLTVHQFASTQPKSEGTKECSLKLTRSNSLEGFLLPHFQKNNEDETTKQASPSNQILSEYIKKIELLQKENKKMHMTYQQMLAFKETQSLELEQLKQEIQLKNDEIKTFIKLYETIGTPDMQDNRRESTQKQTYAEKLKLNTQMNQPPSNTSLNHPNETFSSPAIILKKLPSSMSTATIKDILYREFKKEPRSHNILCTPARERNTLIIKTHDPDHINSISDKIQEIQTLKDITELTIKTSNLRKIIIFGIPEVMQEQEIIEKIKQDYHGIKDINIYKILKRNGKKHYQLVLEVDAHIAQYLVEMGWLQMEFYSFKISKYSPIIRCSHCQMFGHNQVNCNFRPVCAFCAHEHPTNECPNNSSKHKLKCINCTEKRIDNKNHPANSASCPVYQEYFTRRNLILNGRPPVQ